MRRIHLFEFEDLAWLPRFLRNYSTELLSYQLTSTQTYDPIVPLLTDAIHQARSGRVLDLCSGAGSTTLQVFAKVRTNFQVGLSLLLTDKFPNGDQLRDVIAGSDGCAVELESVDALHVPQHMEGFRTMFSAFHHFEPEQARQIIQDAVTKRAPIAVFEFTERSPAFALITLVMAPLLTLLMTPAVRPRTLGRYFWTYILPVMPILHSWDGLVSGLRTYSPAELQELVLGVEGQDCYQWQIGSVRGERGPKFRITYLIGVPK